MSAEGSEGNGSVPLLMGEDETSLNTEGLPSFENSELGSLAGDPMLWAEGYNFELYQKYWSGEGSISFPYEEGIYVGEDQEQEGEKASIGSTFAQAIPSYERIQRFGRERRAYSIAVAQDHRRRSIFVHSSPTHFPDINRARKSAFGSVFLRTTGHVLEDVALLQTVANSSYSMLQSLLNSLDRIISTPTSDSERRHMTLCYKESLLRALEVHGISRAYSDGSVHWNIYPITHNYLFSLQLGDRLHQTRFLSRVEDRILSGPIQKLRLPYEWPTDSVWTGYWDSMGMAGVGTYNMPHGVSYNGKMQDGMFQDTDAMLTYPNQFKALHCVFEKGVLLDCKFQFPDLLMHEKENWNYCQFPDRRFWSEVRKGLKPAKTAQKTEHDPPRNIPTGCYDTSDGFYDPVSLMLVSPSGDLLRVPVCREEHWIKKYCRKGFLEYTDFRPDLYENWFNHDTELIDSILEQQANYRARKITYDDLQQFYANLELLPPWSKFQKKKTESQIALEEFLNSIPPPTSMKKSKKVKKFCGHRIPSKIIADLKMDNLTASVSTNKISKSLLKFDDSKTRNLPLVSSKSSRISYKFPDSYSVSSEETPPPKTGRKIPERYMRHQPILRPPFQSAASIRPRRSDPDRKICTRKSISSSSSSAGLDGEDTGWENKSLLKFMKSIIMEMVNAILIEERQKHRRRLKWAKKPAMKPRENSMGLTENEKCMKVLHELFLSIPDVDEYCDSFPNKTWNLKDLAEDKYGMVQYWGTRIFNLEYDETHSDK